MAKNAYLVITDIHLAFKKDNRYNYLTEIITALDSIKQITDNYREQQYNVIALLLGDVYDASSASPEESMFLLEIGKYFLSNFDKTYAVLGNHEITYQKNNPYWYMVSSIDDDNLRLLRRPIQPKGLYSYINIPDVIYDGNVSFYFNHYGIKPKIAESDRYSIGLFHQNIGSESICRMWGSYDNVETVSYMKSYNIAYMGHIHTVKAAYWLDSDCNHKVEYLGTIGRTSVTEVNNDDLDVNIPVILVEDGELKEIVDNKITLMRYEDCVDNETYERSKLARALIKERKGSVLCKIIGNSLLQSLELALTGTNLLSLFNLCKQPQDNLLYTYNSYIHGEFEINTEPDIDERIYDV